MPSERAGRECKIYKVTTRLLKCLPGYIAEQSTILSGYLDWLDLWWYIWETFNSRQIYRTSLALTAFDVLVPVHSVAKCRSKLNSQPHFTITSSAKLVKITNRVFKILENKGVSKGNRPDPYN